EALEEQTIDESVDADNELEALTEAAFGAITSPSKAPPPPPRPVSAAPPMSGDLRAPPPPSMRASSPGLAAALELEQGDAGTSAPPIEDAPGDGELEPSSGPRSAADPESEAELARQ